MNERSAQRSGDGDAVSAAEASRLFADLRRVPHLVVAVSGGPDSTALLWLLARWRGRLKDGPKLLAVTIDHRLRRESGAEARAVATLAGSLGIPHRTLRWTGAKPKTGISAAARDARYRLLRKAAREAGAAVIVTAHTRDDQAETLMMRMARGSGLTGLAGMARYLLRDDVVIARPLLDMPKARLEATLKRARIGYASDPTNRDLTYTRPRLRTLMPALAKEGFDSHTLARLAARLSRANAALDAVARVAERSLLVGDAGPVRVVIDAAGFGTTPDEIRLRMLLRAIARVGDEGPAELGKAEDLLSVLNAELDREAGARRVRRTLAGAVVTLAAGTLTVERAPSRRSGGR